MLYHASPWYVVVLPQQLYAHLVPIYWGIEMRALLFRHGSRIEHTGDSCQRRISPRLASSSLTPMNTTKTKTYTNQDSPDHRYTLRKQRKICYKEQDDDMIDDTKSFMY